MTLLKVVADKNIQPLIIGLDVKDEIGKKVFCSEEEVL